MKYERLKIGDFLYRSKIPIGIISSQIYKRVTIRINHNGVFLRDEALGEIIGTKKQFILKAGQFILSKIDARYGAFGIAPDEVDGAIITGNFWAYDVDKNKVDIEWFNFFTNSPSFYDVCERASSGITHRKYLDEETFLDYEIIVPDVETQKTIVKRIKKNKFDISTVILEIQHQFDLIHNLRQAFLREAMQGKLVLQDINDEPASVLLERIKKVKQQLVADGKIKKEKPLPPIKPEEIPYKIPGNWVWCRLGDICSKIGSGSTPKGSNYSNDGIPFFRSQNVHNNGILNDDIKYISKEVHSDMRGTVVYTEDLLLNITGGSLGRCALVQNTFEEGNVSQHVCIIRPLLISSFFLHKVILSPYFQKLIFSSTTGAGREGLPKYNLENFPIPLPSQSEQQRIVNKLDELMRYFDELEQNVKTSKEQTEMLLQTVLKEALEGN